MTDVKIQSHFLYSELIYSECSVTRLLRRSHFLVSLEWLTEHRLFLRLLVFFKKQTKQIKHKLWNIIIFWLNITTIFNFLCYPALKPNILICEAIDTWKLNF